MPKKLKGDPLGLFNIHSVVKPKKMKVGIFEEKNVYENKVLRGKPFWFSSLGQHGQFQYL